MRKNKAILFILIILSSLVMIFVNLYRRRQNSIQYYPVIQSIKLYAPYSTTEDHYRITFQGTMFHAKYSNIKRGEGLTDYAFPTDIRASTCTTKNYNKLLTDLISLKKSSMRVYCSSEPPSLKLLHVDYTTGDSDTYVIVSDCYFPESKKIDSVYQYILESDCNGETYNKDMAAISYQKILYGVYKFQDESFMNVKNNLTKNSIMARINGEPDVKRVAFENILGWLNKMKNNYQCNDMLRECKPDDVSNLPPGN